MKSNILFTPILKTKAFSEYIALKSLLTILNQENNVVPYIEVIKDYKDKNVRKYISLFETKPFFLEIENKEILETEKDTNFFPFNCYLVLKVINSTKKEDVLDFISLNRKMRKSFGIKVNNSDSRFDLIFKDLTSSEYLFVDLNGTSYSSSEYLNDLLNYKFSCKTIIHSNERFQYLRGEDFQDDSFNLKANFNTSIIDSIKNGSFKFDGFGSRCSTKNENTEEVKHSNEVYGVFLIYNYSNNNFYSLKSDNKLHIGKVYTSFLPKLRSHKADLETKFLNKNPIADKILSDYILNTKLSAFKIITVSIIIYIEEIIHNL